MTLGRWSQTQRVVLAGSGLLNLGGAMFFAPPVRMFRQAFGFPEAPPLYLWVLSAWVLAFGVAYAHQAWTGRVERAVLALGAVGKAAFAPTVLAHVLIGDMPPIAFAAASPDLVLALLFAAWLWKPPDGVLPIRKQDVD